MCSLICSSIIPAQIIEIGLSRLKSQNLQYKIHIVPKLCRRISLDIPGKVHGSFKIYSDMGGRGLDAPKMVILYPCKM